jgi:hypothetical protein
LNEVTPSRSPGEDKIVFSDGFLQDGTVGVGSPSFFRQPSFAQSIERGLQNRFAGGQPFDAKLGIEAASLGEGGLRPIYIAFERVGGGKIQVTIENTITGVDRPVGFVDCGVQMAEAEFSVRQVIVPLDYPRVTRTKSLSENIILDCIVFAA